MTPQLKPLTKIEKELFDWIKSGQVGNPPKSRTGNTYHGLDRKGYYRTVYNKETQSYEEQILA